MKEVLFAIPDEKYNYFMAQMEKLGFLEYRQDQFEIPKEYQEEILRREANSSDEDYDDWEDIKESIFNLQ